MFKIILFVLDDKSLSGKAGNINSVLESLRLNLVQQQQQQQAQLTLDNLHSQTDGRQKKKEVKKRERDCREGRRDRERILYV